MNRQSGDRIVNIGPRHQRFKNVGEHLRIRARRESGLLRAAQLRRRDGLHGLGDLPRIDHAADAAPDVEDVCHKSVASRWLLVVRCSLFAPRYWVLAAVSQTSVRFLWHYRISSNASPSMVKQSSKH